MMPQTRTYRPGKPVPGPDRKVRRSAIDAASGEPRTAEASSDACVEAGATGV